MTPYEFTRATQTIKCRINGCMIRPGQWRANPRPEAGRAKDGYWCIKCFVRYHSALRDAHAQAIKEAKALGYREIQTFILISETGVSLKAAGWEKVSETSGDTWARQRR